MLNPSLLIKHGIGAITDNAPVLLTAFGAVGTVTTAVLAGKASFEAAEKIFDENTNRGELSPLTLANSTEEEREEIYLTKTDVVKLVWPLYIPAATTGALTVTAIILAHRISAKRAAALAAAYALSNDKFEEYQEKVKEKLGVNKEKTTRDELAQDRINRDYTDDTEVLFSPTDGKVMIREDYTGRFFWSSIDAIEKAVNEVNAHILREGSARLSDFYDVIGLTHVSTSDYFGFVSDNPVELNWSTCTTPDKKTPVHSFEYVHHPVQNPEREARESFR